MTNLVILYYVLNLRGYFNATEIQMKIFRPINHLGRAQIEQISMGIVMSLFLAYTNVNKDIVAASLFRYSI